MIPPRSCLRLICMAAAMCCACAAQGQPPPLSVRAPQVLQEAKVLAAAHNLRGAEELLQGLLLSDDAGQIPPVTRFELELQLAEVWLDSGENNRAVKLLESVQRALTSHRPQAGHVQFLAQRRIAAVCLLARGNAALGRKAQAVALLREQLTVAERMLPAGAVHLCAELAALDQRARFADRPEPTLESVVDALAARLLARGGATPEENLRDLIRFYVQIGRYARAAELAGQLPAPQRFRTMAAIHRASGDARGEKSALASALQLRAGLSTLEKADLGLQAAETSLREGKRDDALELLRQISNELDDVQRDSQSKSGSPPVVLSQRLASVNDTLTELATSDLQLRQAAVVAYEKLERLYTKLLLDRDPRLAMVQIRLATLYLAKDEAPRAIPLLTAAAETCERQESIDYPLWAHVLNLQGEAYLLAEGSADAAGDALRRADEICSQHAPQSELSWWVKLNQARLATMTGRYHRALELFAALGDVPSADSQRSVLLRSSILLHEGLLYKQLLDFDRALERCLAAVALAESEPGISPSNLLSYYTALCGLHTVRRDPAGLAATVQKALEICPRLGESDSRRVLEVRHAEALASFLPYEIDVKADRTPQRAHYDAAEAHWQELLTLCPATDGSALRARVHHQLARLEHLRWSSARQAASSTSKRSYEEQIAAVHQAWDSYRARFKDFRQQLDAYDKARGRAKPAELAELQERFKALEREREALATMHSELPDFPDRPDFTRVNSPEMQAALAAAQQHAAAASRLLADSHRFPNLKYASYCNEAQILHAAGDADRAIERLEAAVGLAQGIRQSPSSDRYQQATFFVNYLTAFDLLVEFHVERQQLREALLAAERGRSLTLRDQLRSADIVPPEQPDEARAAIDAYLESGEPLLYYYIGADRSYLFLAGGTEQQLQAVSLRGAAGERLSSADFSRIVRSIQAALYQPSFEAFCQDQTLEGDSLRLLPLEVQQYLEKLRAEGADHVTVVPHGLLTRIPLEALTMARDERTADGSAPRFVIDAAPPLAYVPSLVFWYHVVHGSGTSSAPSNPHATGGLVTLAAGLVSSATASISTATAPPGTAHTSQRPVLVPLRFATEESNGVLREFKEHLSGKAIPLQDNHATELELRRALATSPRVLHVAAHGMVGQEAFAAAILLAPPQTDVPWPADNDGRLDLREIYDLKLSGCELTVLSACSTNVSGWMEMADSKENISATLDPTFSLAAGFLAAHSRRVLASQWEVEDESTKELVLQFFAELSRQVAAGQQINYARCLTQARDAIRRTTRRSDWRAPYYWASFVLIGPSIGTAQSLADH